MADYISRQAVIDTLQGTAYNDMSDLVNRYCTTATMHTKAGTENLLGGSYINQIKVGGNTGVIRDAAAHDEIAELREMIERLKGRPYYMKIQCHNCGAPLTIDSSNHLVKCRYCHTAYFSGTQLVNSGI